MELRTVITAGSDQRLFEAFQSLEFASGLLLIGQEILRDEDAGSSPAEYQVLPPIAATRTTAHNGISVCLSGLPAETPNYAAFETLDRLDDLALTTTVEALVGSENYAVQLLTTIEIDREMLKRDGFGIPSRRHSATIKWVSGNGVLEPLAPARH